MDLLIFEHFAHLATDDDDLHVICVCSHLLQLLCCSVPSCRLVSVPKKAKNSFSVTTTTATALFLSIIIMIPIFHDNIIFSLSLSITVRPESRPEILGFFDEYTLDKAIDALCTSKRSYPAAQLDFFINDEPVSLGIIVCQILFG